jgi:hypothetical protein
LKGSAKSSAASSSLWVGDEREDLNAKRCVGPDHQDEALHFYVCKTCGQAVDMRRLGDVLYHEEAEHEPLPIE